MKRVTCFTVFGVWLLLGVVGCGKGGAGGVKPGDSTLRVDDVLAGGYRCAGLGFFGPLDVCKVVGMDGVR